MAKFLFGTVNKCWNPQVWTRSTLTQGQRVQACSCPSRLLTGGLTQDVSTNRMFWPSVWLLDALGIEKVITVPSILIKKSFFFFLLLFGLGHIKPMKNSQGQIQYSLGCPSKCVLDLCIFFCTSVFIFCLKFLTTHPYLWAYEPDEAGPQQMRWAI